MSGAVQNTAEDKKDVEVKEMPGSYPFAIFSPSRSAYLEIRISGDDFSCFWCFTGQLSPGCRRSRDSCQGGSFTAPRARRVPLRRETDVTERYSARCTWHSLVCLARTANRTHLCRSSRKSGRGALMLDRLPRHRSVRKNETVTTASGSRTTG